MTLSTSRAARQQRIIEILSQQAIRSQPQLLETDTVDLRVDLPALLRGRLVLPVVQMGQPVVLLEVAPDGRKSWLLDRSQSDDSSGVQVGRLSLRQGQLGYDDVYYFSRLFRKVVGMAPSHYRALHQG